MSGKSASPAVREKLRALGRLPLPEASLIVFLLLSAVYVGGTKPSAPTNGGPQSVSAEPAVPAASGGMSFAVADAEGGGATLYTLPALAEGGGVVTQRLTAAQYAAGFALANVLTNSGWLSVPANAVVHAPWTRHGVAEDTFYAPASNWSFVLDSNSVAGAHVSSSGTLSFGLLNIPVSLWVKPNQYVTQMVMPNTSVQFSYKGKPAGSAFMNGSVNVSGWPSSSYFSLSGSGYLSGSVYVADME